MHAKPSTPHRIEASWIVALACAALLLAQAALALHQIDHFSHPHEGVCELCAMAAGGAPMPAAAPSLELPRLHLRLPALRLDDLAPERRSRPGYQPRAPPEPPLIA